MDGMEYIDREIDAAILRHLKRGKSILLLGPRQTGKTTLLKKYEADIYISFARIKSRQRYEIDPSLLTGEVESLYEKKGKSVFVIIDEIQKVPEIMDAAQDLIDRKIAQFILTGSSARKLRRAGNINLLPGRVVSLRLDPFIQSEYPFKDLKKVILYGSLPSIVLQENDDDKEIDIESYVETYLEEEVRLEALVRNVGKFSRFLEYAGIESGKIVSFRSLSQIIGVSHTTIASYYEILKDCLIAERVEPYFKSKTRKKLTKSAKYLIFDLGVRRVCARESVSGSENYFGPLFEQFVGLELIRFARLSQKRSRIYFWRDPDGPEVDWLIDRQGELIPIEVKWSETPKKQYAKHLITFLSEYPESKKGFVICRTPTPVKLAPNITAVNWTTIPELV